MKLTGGGGLDRVWEMVQTQERPSHRTLYMQRLGGKRKHSKSEQGLKEGRVAGLERKRLKMSLEIVERNHTGHCRMWQRV